VPRRLPGIDPSPPSSSLSVTYSTDVLLDSYTYVPSLQREAPTPIDLCITSIRPVLASTPSPSQARSTFCILTVMTTIIRSITSSAPRIVFLKTLTRRLTSMNSSAERTKSFPCLHARAEEAERQCMASWRARALTRPIASDGQARRRNEQKEFDRESMAPVCEDVVRRDSWQVGTPPQAIPASPQSQQHPISSKQGKGVSGKGD
jgi:hypothetical protein